MREQSIGEPRVARPFIFQTGYVNYSRPPHGGADRIGTERIVILKTYDRLCAGARSALDVRGGMAD